MVTLKINTIRSTKNERLGFQTGLRIKKDFQEDFHKELSKVKVELHRRHQENSTTKAVCLPSLFPDEPHPQR